MKDILDSVLEMYCTTYSDLGGHMPINTGLQQKPEVSSL